MSIASIATTAVPAPEGGTPAPATGAKILGSATDIDSVSVCGGGSTIDYTDDVKVSFAPPSYQLAMGFLKENPRCWVVRPPRGNGNSVKNDATLTHEFEGTSCAKGSYTILPHESRSRGEDDSEKNFTRADLIFDVNGNSVGTSSAE